MRKQLNFDTKLENVIANVIVTNYIEIELLFRMSFILIGFTLLNGS